MDGPKCMDTHPSYHRLFDQVKSLRRFDCFVPCTPVPKQSVQMGSGTFFTPPRQARYVKFLKKKFKEEYGVRPLFSGNISVKIVYVFPFRKQDRGLESLGWIPHVQIPDFDNLTKPVLDSLRGSVVQDDRIVFHSEILKVRAKKPGVFVSVRLCRILRV